jgi:hypothetical protein
MESAWNLLGFLWNTWRSVKTSVLLVFKGLVWSSFLTPRGVNHGPELVPTDANSSKTATEPIRTSPNQFDCGLKTGSDWFFLVISPFYHV